MTERRNVLRRVKFFSFFFSSRKRFPRSTIVYIYIYVRGASLFSTMIYELRLFLSVYSFPICLCVSAHTKPTNQSTDRSIDRNNHRHSSSADRLIDPAQYDTKNCNIKGSRRRRPSKFCTHTTQVYKIFSLSFFLHPVSLSVSRFLSSANNGVRVLYRKCLFYFVLFFFLSNSWVFSVLSDCRRNV